MWEYQPCKKMCYFYFRNLSDISEIAGYFTCTPLHLHTGAKTPISFVRLNSPRKEAMEKKKKTAEDRLDLSRSKIPKPINPILDSRVSLKFADARRAKRVRFEEPNSLSPLSSKPIACTGNTPGILSAKDAKRSKRVRFEEPGSLPPLTFKPIAYSGNAPGILSAEGDDPKTSEYAFYKKLREDAAHTFPSNQPHKQHEQWEKSEAQSHTKEMTKVVKPIYETRSLSPTEKETPAALSSSPKPRVSLNAGSECDYAYKDIFFIKRQKLLNLAVEASSLDIDMLCSKGFDFVPMLLQRLHPESNEIAKTSCLSSKSMPWEIKLNSKSQLHGSRESDILLEDTHRTPSMSLVSPFSGKNLSGGFLEYWPDKPKECNLSPDVNEDLGPLLPRLPQKLLGCEKNMPSELVDYWGSSSLHASRDSDSSVQPHEFLFDRSVYPALDYLPNQSRHHCPAYKSLSLDLIQSDNSFCLSSGSSFKELSDLYYPKLVSDAKQFGGFIGCSAMEDEQNLNSYSGAATNSSPTWRTASEDNLQRLNYILDGTEVQSPSSRAICHYSDISLGKISSRNCLINTAGRQTPEDNLRYLNGIMDGTGIHCPPTQGTHYYSDITLANKSLGTYCFKTVGMQTPEREYQDELPENLSSPLYCTPKYLALEERCRSRSIEHQTSIIPSPVSSVKYTSKIFGEKDSPWLGTRLQSSIGLDYGFDGLPSNDHLKEFPLSTCSDKLGKDTRGAFAFLLTRDKTERYMGSFSDNQCHTEDLYHSYDLPSLNFNFPSKKYLCSSLDAPHRNGSGDCNEDIVGQFF